MQIDLEFGSVSNSGDSSDNKAKTCTNKTEPKTKRNVVASKFGTFAPVASQSRTSGTKSSDTPAEIAYEGSPSASNSDFNCRSPK